MTGTCGGVGGLEEESKIESNKSIHANAYYGLVLLIFTNDFFGQYLI